MAEQHLGIFSGLGYDEVKNHQDYQQDPLARWDWIPRGGGESYQMVANRVVDFLKDIHQKFDGEKVLIVTHAGVFRLLRGVLENTLPKYSKNFPNNGEIWSVEYTGLGRRHEIQSIFLGESRKFVHNP